MTWVLVGLLVGLTTLTGPALRRDIRRAEERRRKREALLAEIRSVASVAAAMRSIAVEMRKFQPAFKRVDDRVDAMACALAEVGRAVRTPFKPSEKQKGEPE